MKMNNLSDRDLLTFISYLEQNSDFNILKSKLNLQLFAEALLNLEEAKASSLDIYTRYYKEAMDPEEYKLLVFTDPTSQRGEGPDTESILASSQNGNYVKWLTHARTPMLVSDTGGEGEINRKQVSDALIKFDKAKRNKEGAAKLIMAAGEAGLDLDEDQATSINFYLSWRHLVTTMEYVDDPEIGTKREDRIKIFFEDNHWKVVIPKTPEASQKYGTGTNWCTATSNHSFFNGFCVQNSKNPIGPLYIIKNKDLAKDPEHNLYKWQYHPATKQFQDQNNSASSPAELMEVKLREFPSPQEEEEQDISLQNLFAAFESMDPKLWDYKRFSNAGGVIAQIRAAMKDQGTKDIMSLEFNQLMNKKMIKVDALAFATLRGDIKDIRYVVDKNGWWPTSGALTAIECTMSVNDYEKFQDVLSALLGFDGGTMFSWDALLRIKPKNRRNTEDNPSIVTSLILRGRRWLHAALVSSDDSLYALRPGGDGKTPFINAMELPDDSFPFEIGDRDMALVRAAKEVVDLVMVVHAWNYFGLPSRAWRDQHGISLNKYGEFEGSAAALARDLGYPKLSAYFVELSKLAAVAQGVEN